MKQQIEKIEMNDYSTFATVYIKADKETIAMVTNYVSELNKIIEAAKTTTDDSKH